MSKRRRGRESGLQIIFAMDASGVFPAVVAPDHTDTPEEEAVAEGSRPGAEHVDSISERVKPVKTLNPDVCVQRYWDELSHNADGCDFANELALGVAREREALDEKIAEKSQAWRMDRMSAIDRNVLRLCCYEMWYCEGIPVRASLNEAIELAKKYGTEFSAAFVNGVLDSMVRKNGELPKSDASPTSKDVDESGGLSKRVSGHQASSEKHGL